MEKVSADDLRTGKHFEYRRGVYVINSDGGATNIKTGRMLNYYNLPDKVTPVKIKSAVDIIR